MKSTTTNTNPFSRIGLFGACLMQALLMMSCGSVKLEDDNRIYFKTNQTRVVCAAGLDAREQNDRDSLLGGLVRAKDNDEILLLYAHSPGADFSTDTLDWLLTKANELELPTVTFADLSIQTQKRAGLQISFDDAHIKEWHEMNDVLVKHNAHVSFFITRYHRLSEEELSMLSELAASGHSIEAHGKNHLDSASYSEEHGVEAWLDNEFQPSIDVMTADGWTPSSYAYPFGTRTNRLDDLALNEVKLVRSIARTFGFPISDPCPL